MCRPLAGHACPLMLVLQGTRGLWSWPLWMFRALPSCRQRQAILSQVSRKIMLRRWMTGGWSGKNLAFVTGRSSGIAVCGVGCPKFSFLGAEEFVRNSELSGNLAHEFLPFPGPD